MKRDKSTYHDFINDSFFAHLAVLLVSLQLLLVPLSWIVSAAFPALEVRSLLSGEGIRWFAGSINSNLSSPLLVWIMLLFIALGAMQRSGLWLSLRSITRLNYRERLALRLVLAELLAIIVIVFALTLVPHAPLLNVTGHIYPSSFSSGLVAIIALSMCLFAFTYAVAVSQKRTARELFSIFTHGLRSVAPLLVDYLLAAELYHSVIFVLP